MFGALFGASVDELLDVLVSLECPQMVRNVGDIVLKVSNHRDLENQDLLHIVDHHVDPVLLLLLEHS